jgi:hypothetical protein
MFIEVMDDAILLDIAPCGPYVNRRFGGIYHLHLQCPKSAEQETRVYQVAHIRTTQHYIPEDGNIHNYRWENLRSYIEISSVFLESGHADCKRPGDITFCFII